VPRVQTIMLFMATALALNLTPGPSILFILSRCLGQGRVLPSRRFLVLLPPSFKHSQRHLGYPRSLYILPLHSTLSNTVAPLT
jgi:hypothetical protein